MKNNISESIINKNYQKDTNWSIEMDISPKGKAPFAFNIEIKSRPVKHDDIAYVSISEEKAKEIKDLLTPLINVMINESKLEFKDEK